jgi:DNA-binding NarL/FixJ family response regulator
MVRTGLAKLISERRRFSVVASVGDPAELTDTPPTDLVLLDLPAPADVRILDVIGRLAARSRVLVTSTWTYPPTPLSTVRVGVRACLTRQSDEQVVLSALDTVAGGGLYICPDLVARLPAELSTRFSEDPAGLTPREIETLRWIACGLTHGQIATRMGLTEATVNTYAKRLRAKLNVGNKAQLTRVAIELGHLDERRPSHPAA